MVLSLYAKGLITGEISGHFAEIYGASVSRETISRITGKVIEEMTDWCNRPLDEIYAAAFIDAVMVKVRVLSPAGPSTPRSASPWLGRKASWGCGPAPAARAPSAG
jgi:Transposase, Mutator family